MLSASGRRACLRRAERNAKHEGVTVRKLVSIIISVLSVVDAGAAKPVNPLTVTGEGWSVTINEERHTLSISHEILGTLLSDVRLNLRSEGGLAPLNDWSIETKGQNQLSLRAVKPATCWAFKLSPDALRISSTSPDAVLTAKAPAPSGRIVARLSDPGGIPVTWEGTEEVNVGYGGSLTKNPSYLPRRNPEVMYFGLGQVSSLNFHALFDCKTDTAIAFSDTTKMQRSPEEPDLLEVTIPVPGNSLVRLIPDYYTKTLGVPFYVPFDNSHFAKAPVVWCSWDSRYEDVREEDIVRNVDWIAAHLEPYGFEYIVIDEGYDLGGNSREHYWTEKWNQKKFPHDPKWLAQYIKSRGLHPGLWLVPNTYAGAVGQHPDWYLKDRNGKMILDYGTPALDSTNPEVLDFLKREFETLDAFGFEYYKFDGEYAIPKYVSAVDTDRLYDKLVDPLAAYRNRLKLIRETVGVERFIEGCPAGTPLNGIGYFNSYFNGEDMYSSWHGNYAMFSSINGNGFLNHIVVYTMPGEGIEVGPQMSVEEAMKTRPAPIVEVARTRESPFAGLGTTLAEARTLVSYISLTGVVYSLSSVTPELPEERVKLLKMTMPTMPILPIDLYSRGTDLGWDTFKHTTPDDYIHNYPEVLDLKVNAPAGIYDVVAMTNWRSWTAHRDLAFADKLGVDPQASYVVFDFWAQKLLGIFKGQMAVTIEPHDTKVFLVHPLLDRPQLIGTSRHITGAYSIRDLTWDGSKNLLRATSDAVPGDDYTLWFHVPKGVDVSHVEAEVNGKGKIPAHYQLADGSLGASFKGQEEPVQWEIGFRGTASHK